MVFDNDLSFNFVIPCFEHEAEWFESSYVSIHVFAEC